jgi:gamma-glutamylcyclotransferase (GGCT)/AIG2-like uncharacterized protein YtfP
MNRHLFVYGSLMSSAGHRMGKRLAREARHIGEASAPGRLYKVGRYPGMVAGGAEGERVHGEVYALHNPVQALRWLDAYEGLAEGSPHHGEYARCELPVRLASGTAIRCWAYVYCRDVSGLPALADGRWVAEPSCNRRPPRQNS